ncbi:MAG: glycosyltransferase family 2 protein [Candidatus Cyclobacteriaceae bacterium M3_2C_046]
MRDISIVLLNYNGQKYLKEFLPKVIKYSPGCEIVVADNHSTDDSIQYIKKNHPEVVIIELEKNEGFSRGYNLALQQVEAAYYILLNTDIEVSEGWIDPAIDLMAANDHIVACQPKILAYQDHITFEYAGGAGGYIDILGYPFCRGRIFDTLEKDQGQYNDRRRIFWASGACLFIRAEVFHMAGGFDDDFFAHMEEIDLCWRLNNAGFEIYYVPSATVYHVGGGTLPASNPYKTYLNFRNSLSMLYKNTSFWQLLWKMPLRFLLDLVAAMKFLVADSPGHFKAVLKGIYDFTRMYRNNRSKKIETISFVNQYDSSQIYHFLIIIDYFIRKRKKYSQLNFIKDQ